MHEAQCATNLPAGSVHMVTLLLPMDRILPEFYYLFIDSSFNVDTFL